MNPNGFVSTRCYIIKVTTMLFVLTSSLEPEMQWLSFDAVFHNNFVIRQVFRYVFHYQLYIIHRSSNSAEKINKMLESIWLTDSSATGVGRYVYTYTYIIDTKVWFIRLCIAGRVQVIELNFLNLFFGKLIDLKFADVFKNVTINHNEVVSFMRGGHLSNRMDNETALSRWN